MKKHYNDIISLTEELVPFILKSQDLNPNSIHYGGCIIPSKGFSEPVNVVKCIDTLISLYYNQDSVYYCNREFLERIILFLNNLLNEQHHDGTIDLKETNFHDATANAFAIQCLAYTYRLVQKYSRHSQYEDQMLELMLTFIQRSGEGMRKGGFHTPNHRWVMASALSLIYQITGNNIYKEEVLLYLNEGIDCDEEGEYTERSVGIYDAIVNNSLIILAEEMGKPELLEYVHRNLCKVYKYFEPDNTILTLNSSRQDKGKDVYPIAHYWAYYYMGYIRKNPKFAYIADCCLNLMTKMANKIGDINEPYNKIGFHNLLTKFMLDEKLIDFEIDFEKPDLNFEHWFKHSGVVRKREENTTVTLLTENDIFMKVQKGRNRIHLRFAASFFARGRFRAQEIEKIDGGYRLSYSVRHGYVRPFTEHVNTKNWHEMDHEKREKVNIQTFEVNIDVLFQGNNIVMLLNSEGVEKVPYKLELIFEPGGTMETSNIKIPGKEGMYALLKNEEFKYCLDYDIITVIGGICEHNYVCDMRGTEPQQQDEFTVYLAGFTPMQQMLTISI